MKKSKVIAAAALTLLVFSTISLHSQSFNPVVEYGWGGGTTHPKPCIIDMDNDGNLDMLIGTKDGTILHYEQNPEEAFNFKLISNLFNNIIVNEEAAPFLYDIDGDGLLDLLVGEEEDIWHYEQDAPESYSFTLISENFITLGGFGFYLKPVVTNIDDDGLVDLLVGSDFDVVSYYEQLNPGTYDFTLVTSQFNGVFTEYPASFCTGYIDDNNSLDILSGHYNGLSHYEQYSPNSIYFQLITYNFGNFETGNNPNPFIIDLTDDGLTDLFVAGGSGNTSCYEKYLKEYKTFTKIIDSIAGVGAPSDATPTILDIDGDGLLDLLVGAYNAIMHYEQAEPYSWDFSLINDNFLNFSEHGIYIDCMDINNDGLLDMLIGDSDGRIMYYEQESSNSNDFNLVTDFFNDINTYSTPTRPLLYDFDDDGLLDLITGVDYSNNHLYHYEQTSINSLTFAVVEDEISGLMLDNYYGGWDIADLNGNNQLDIVVTISGVLKYLEESSPGSLDFVVIDENYISTPQSGIYDLCPKFADIDGDGQLDMLVGESGGSIIPYEEDLLPSYGFQLSSTNLLESIDVGVYSSSTFCNLNNDGLIDLLIGSNGGTLRYYSQTETGSYEFELVNETFSDINLGNNEYLTPTATDLNGNAKLDLIIGNHDGELVWYEQSEPGSLEFSLIFSSLSNIDVGYNAIPSFSDLDNDGLLDLLIGQEGGTIAYYKQDAPQSYYFSPVNPNFNAIDVGDNSAPFVSDIDNNGLLDLLVGNENGVIFHYIQDSQYSLDFSLENNNYGSIEVSGFSKPNLADLNNDGYIDLLVGKSTGGIDLYLQEDQTQEIPMQENFLGCDFPNYWSQEASGSLPFSWSVENTNYAGAYPCEIKAAQYNGVGTTRLKTPFFYIEDWDNITLDFKHFFEDAGTGLTAKIQWSEDGSTWTDAGWEISSGNGSIGPETVSVDVSGLGGDIMCFAFTLEGDHNQFVAWNVDDIWCYNIESPPSSTNPINPTNGNFAFNGTSLMWDEVPNATAYRLFFGTDNPPTNIENGTSIAENQYTPQEYLNEGTTYYWKVVPYNSFGDATGCEIWGFTVWQLNPPVNLFGEAFESHVQLTWEPPLEMLDSLLVVDLDLNHNSGPTIKNILAVLGYGVRYEVSMPPDLDLYSAIFVCLGVFSSNYALQTDEGQKLAGYLNNGGNLYMEGGDTWYYDSPTAVHPMFNINGISDGSGDLNIIQGIDGTPSSGMAFAYNGENNWIDHIAPMADAELLLKNDMPEYGVAVANTEGETYNTIGASFEFAGLVDGAAPSTKESLMIKYLQLFDLLGKQSGSYPSESVLGYNVYRSDNEGVNFAQINYQLISETSYEDIVPDTGTYYYHVKAIYDQGISVPSNEVFVDVIVGIDETFDSGLSVYPNPASENILITSTEPITHVSIFNCVGVKVFEMKADDLSLSCPVSKLKQGVYYLKVDRNDAGTMRKVIIQR